MYILTNLRNIFIFTFLHNLRGAPSQPIDLDACAVCHISINPSNPLNPLQDVKMGFENLMKFCKTFNHTDSEKHLERQEQLHENYRKIKLHKNCQRYMYNQNKKRPTTIALLPEEKTASKILRSSMETSEWRSKCKFCCGTCQKNIRHPNQNNCHELPK